jgi:hypothetical protein
VLLSDSVVVGSVVVGSVVVGSVVVGSVVVGSVVVGSVVVGSVVVGSVLDVVGSVAVGAVELDSDVVEVEVDVLALVSVVAESSPEQPTSVSMPPRLKRANVCVILSPIVTFSRPMKVSLYLDYGHVCRLSTTDKIARIYDRASVRWLGLLPLDPRGPQRRCSEPLTASRSRLRSGPETLDPCI